MVIPNIEYEDRFTNMKLKEIALEFLDQNNFLFQENTKSSGISGQEYTFQFLITGQKTHSTNDNISTGIILKDYKKSVGSDGICQAERLLKDCPEINKVVMISNEFSVPARNLARRCGVPLISRGELISMLIKPKSV